MRPGPGRRALQPRRHRPHPVAVVRPAAALPAHQPEPRRRLRPLARGRHAERAGESSRSPPCRRRTCSAACSACSPRECSSTWPSPEGEASRADGSAEGRASRVRSPGAPPVGDAARPRSPPRSRHRTAAASAADEPRRRRCGPPWPSSAASRRRPRPTSLLPTQVWPTLAELGGSRGRPRPTSRHRRRCGPPSLSSGRQARWRPPATPLRRSDSPRSTPVAWRSWRRTTGSALRTHFQVLGVPRDATEAQVREAYFRLAKRFHPDVHHDAALSDLRDKLEEIFTRLGEAYEVLCSPRIRAELRAGAGPAGGGAGPIRATPSDPRAGRRPPRRRSRGAARAWPRSGTGKPSGSSSPPFPGPRGPSGSRPGFSSPGRTRRTRAGSSRARSCCSPC